MALPEHQFQTQNISLATALLCTDYAYVVDGAPNERVHGGDVVHLDTKVVGERGHCEFTFGYSDAEEFEHKCGAFSAGTLMVPPVHFDRKKKLIVDSMREARKQKE